MKHTPALLPCPFCGNEKPELIEIPTAPDHWRVGCSKCGSYNNYSRGSERAVKQWNQRAVNTIEALEKSHSELLAALEEVDSYPLPARIHRNIAGAIANAQPVVTMLREGRG